MPYDLGGQRGLRLLRRVREHFRTVPIIVLTGVEDSTLELKIYRAGARAFFLKPCFATDLLAEVAFWIGIKEDPDLQFLRLRHEFRELDYKADLPLETTTDRASLAKDVIAMSNSGGGRIVVGVPEVAPGQFELRGLPSAALACLEVTRINNSIEKFVAGAVKVQSRVLTYEGAFYVVIHVPPVSDTIVFSACDNAQAGLFQGRVYHRTDDARSSQVTDSLTAKRMLETKRGR